ncbi:hypothetical protein N7508_003067 [Penicillium antarcticum]|uniref:uncharacterized protein n=1 Tax=Penicillium antarcticum TaxID=416450 RepID=UPI002393896D|nr:uncharacterized protein N7508_003067 [Penicillium antarcticum]KAJ5312237.1 hypothetical protein N7508_003067 [Penicillium antarcticum]
MQLPCHLANNKRFLAGDDEGNDDDEDDNDDDEDEDKARSPINLVIIEACDYDTRFQYKPIPALFNESYVAAARATMQMPKLE